ncbi:MAG: hypothetical protein NUV98_07215, partial [Candidatus Roizmanbacteria bacterium]|nr:hypothetical protein [Candidatus Roizmanbacteria bacterium]
MSNVESSFSPTIEGVVNDALHNVNAGIVEEIKNWASKQYWTGNPQSLEKARSEMVKRTRALQYRAGSAVVEDPIALLHEVYEHTTDICSQLSLEELISCTYEPSGIDFSDHINNLKSTLSDEQKRERLTDWTVQSCFVGHIQVIGNNEFIPEHSNHQPALSIDQIDKALKSIKLSNSEINTFPGNSMYENYGRQKDTLDNYAGNAAHIYETAQIRDMRVSLGKSKKEWAGVIPWAIAESHVEYEKAPFEELSTAYSLSMSLAMFLLTNPEKLEVHFKNHGKSVDKNQLQQLQLMIEDLIGDSVQSADHKPLQILFGNNVIPMPVLMSRPDLARTNIGDGMQLVATEFENAFGGAGEDVVIASGYEL